MLLTASHTELTTHAFVTQHAEVIEALARVAVASDAIADASGEQRRGERGRGLTV